MDETMEVPPAVEEQIRRSVLAALEAEEVGVPCVVAVIVTDDGLIRETNLAHRGVDRATDVLSFPMFPMKPGDKPRAEWADPGADIRISKCFTGNPSSRKKEETVPRAAEESGAGADAALPSGHQSSARWS